MSALQNKAWSETRILISGARGFLGWNLAQRLVSLGAQVHGTSRVSRMNGGLHWHTTEWREEADIRSVLNASRPDVVVHFAGHVSAHPDLSLVDPTFNSLLFSTVNLLRAATSFPVSRIVIVGSIEEPLNTPPTSPYAAAKASASLYSKMFHQLYGTPVVIVKPSLTFGPHQAHQKLVPYVIRCALEGRTPQLTSGTRQADWIYISDVVAGFLAAISETSIEGMTFELGTGRLLSTRQLVEKLLDVLQSSVRPHFGAIEDRPGEKARAADSHLATIKLNWSAVTPLEHALHETVTWYTENDFRSCRN